jgi:hypothetical protein
MSKQCHVQVYKQFKPGSTDISISWPFHFGCKTKDEVDESGAVVET